MRLRIGGTYSLGRYSDISEIIRHAKSIGSNAIQLVLFANNPYYPSEEDIEYVINSDMYIVCHGTITINLCNRGSQYTFARNEVIRELQITEAFNCDLVLHQGKMKNVSSYDEAVKLYVDAITEILNLSKTSNTNILLENSCGAGSEIGYNIEQLQYIYSRFSETTAKRIGFCIDTCHSFVSGVVDYRNLTSVKQFVKEFDERIGLDKIRLIHLNDSKSKYKSHSDRHADWSIGEITNTSLYSGIEYFVRKLNSIGIPFVLETSSHIYKENIIFIKTLMLIAMTKKAEKHVNHLRKICEIITRKKNEK